MSDDSFLGAGMKFPPQIDPGTGRFAVSSGSRSVRESVYLILMTNQGERWLQPRFGSDMVNYTFMDSDPTMNKMISDEIVEMLTKQEPRLTDVEVELDDKSRAGCMIISINYKVAGSNAAENLVFPFYLNNGREEEEE